MFDIGFLELVLVFIIALLVLGPERLPHAAHTLGKWVGRARRLVSKFTQEIDKELEIEALKAKLREQGQSLDINDDVRMIQETVSNALSEAESDDDYGHGPHGDFEPLPRKDTDKPYAANSSVPPSSQATQQPKEQLQANGPASPQNQPLEQITPQSSSDNNTPSANSSLTHSKQ